MENPAAAARETALVSFGEYLEFEKRAENRHEYADGRMLAMAGASEAHEIVAGGLFAAIYLHLKGSACRAFKGDMKLRVEIQGREVVYYPDVMITCDPSDNHPLYKVRPKVLVEVMSDYKADHIEKLFAYQQIASLEEYLVVDQDPAVRQAWLYRRETGWVQENGSPGGRLSLSAIDFELPLADVYL